MCGAELSALPEGVQRVARALQDAGHPHGPVMLDDAARTAQQAADALGIAVNAHVLTDDVLHSRIVRTVPPLHSRV